MQAVQKEISVASSRRVMLVMMSLNTLYEYMYASMLSSALGMLPVYGGAMFMSASVAKTASHYLGDGSKYLTRRMRVSGIVIFAIILLCVMLLNVMYPAILSSPNVWIVCMAVLTASARAGLGRRLTARRMRRTIGVRAYWAIMILLHVLPLGIMTWLLFAAMPAANAWPMLAGFAVGGVLEDYTLWRERDNLAFENAPDDIDRETVRHIADELKEVNAFSVYQRMHLLVLTALQLTLVAVYTFIGLTNRELFTCMLIAVGCAIVMREISMLCLKRVRRPSVTQLLLIGLFLWIYGLFLFYQRIAGGQNLQWGYLALCLSISGLTVSVTSLNDLETRMTSVAEFKLKAHMRGYSQMRAASTELALLLGQMIALVLMTLLCMPTGIAANLDLARFVSAFRPLMVIPPLLVLLVAVFSVLRFPLNKRHFQKLARFLTLESEGGDNPALRKQLDSVVVKRHKNRFGIRVLITIMRPLYYHKVYGVENIAGFTDGDMVLVCNHGEIYGPVAANLYIPISFRPWVINSMMDKDVIVDHMYEGSMRRQKWLPESWKKPILSLFKPLFVWVFNSLDAIPVYRSDPRSLIKTFRQTIEAMQAGDNILLFPENDEGHEPGVIGYTLAGVGKLFSGFEMIAPMYYAKTKRRAVFVPIYASRRTRSLLIGQGIEYNPDNNASDEKQRILDTLLDRMNEMYIKQERKEQEDGL